MVYGLTILNSYTETITEYTNPELIPLGVGLMLIFLGIALGGAFSKDGTVTCVGLICAVMIFIMGLFYTRYAPKKEETYHEAVVSDNVSLKEFREKYEIVEQRGELFVIKERE